MAKATTEEARRLARLSSDCSFLLTHMIRQNGGLTNIEARRMLRSILRLSSKQGHLLLRASPVGWYSNLSPYVFNPETGKLDGEIKAKAVCFTESTLAGLRAHRDVFSVKYGLAFDRDALFDNGANPCLNIREDILKSRVHFKGVWDPRRLYNFIPRKLQPFINIINESFDATHEREWRFPGDMRFQAREVRFIFCPEKDFPAFSLMQKKGLPVLFDLKWLDRI